MSAQACKRLLNIVLVVNCLVEVPVGLLLVLSPESFLPSGESAGIVWARNYGVAAFAIGTLALWIWPYRDNYAAVSVALGFLVLFNWTLTGALITSGGQVPGAILHFILATLFTLLYFQRRRWCEVEPVR